MEDTVVRNTVRGNGKKKKTIYHSEIRPNSCKGPRGCYMLKVPLQNTKRTRA